MKTRNLTALIALGSVLPLAAWGQSSSAGSGSSGQSSGSSSTDTSGMGSSGQSSGSQTGSGSGSSTGSSYGSGSGSGSSGTSGTSGSTGSTYGSGSTGTSGSTGSSYGSTGSSSAGSVGAGGSAGIHRVSQNGLNSRLTASSLIGKKVVDQNGKDVGTVKDIGLASVLPSDLRMSSSQNSGSGSSSASNRSSSLSSTATRAGNEVGALGQRMTGNVNVFVTVGGVFGIGGDLIAVPANQLRRDGDNLKIDLSQDQLKTIASSSQADSYNSTSE